MRPGSSRAGTAAPITRMVFWTMVSMAAWELYQGLRIGAAVPTGAWPLSGVDVVFLVLIPAVDDVAQADAGADLCVYGCQHASEGREVAVNVGDHAGSARAHDGSPSVSPV